MTSKLRISLLSASLLLAAGALSPTWAQVAAPAQPAAPAAPAAAAPAEPAKPTAAAMVDVVAGKVSAPAAGKGQVVFFRPSNMAGWALSFSVHEAESGVGKLSNGTYFIVTAEPGAHTYTIQSEAKDNLTLEVEAGETYFVKQTIGMGLVVGRPHLSPSDKAAFEKSNPKLSSMKATDLKASKHN